MKIKGGKFLITGGASMIGAHITEQLLAADAREIVLQCGRASLVLTRAGKVLLRGSYVSLRSSGMQRITGASVQIN